MSQYFSRDRIRQAFGALTRPPRPQLAERIRDSLWGRPAPRGRRPAPAVPPAALLAALLVLALVAGAVLEGPALARRLAPVVEPVAALPGHLLAPRTASRPPSTPGRTPSSRPGTSPSQSPGPPASATPLPAESATPAPPAATPPAAPVSTLPGFSCAAQDGGGSVSTSMTTARVGAQAGYDRFVVQFDGGLPQFDVVPQGSATFSQGGGTSAVTLDGSAGLVVTLRNATGAGVYGGPTDMRPGFAVIREARLLSDYQGVVEWAIGLAHASCFHAWTLGSPSRVVVDIAD